LHPLEQRQRRDAVPKLPVGRARKLDQGLEVGLLLGIVEGKRVLAAVVQEGGVGHGGILGRFGFGREGSGEESGRHPDGRTHEDVDRTRGGVEGRVEVRLGFLHVARDGDGDAPKVRFGRPGARRAGGNDLFEDRGQVDDRVQQREARLREPLDALCPLPRSVHERDTDLPRHVHARL
jgi:hypothetical protein